MAAVSDIVFTAPLAYLAGVGTGFVLASRYRIVRARPPNMTDSPPNGG